MKRTSQERPAVGDPGFLCSSPRGTVTAEETGETEFTESADDADPEPGAGGEC